MLLIFSSVSPIFAPSSVVTDPVSTSMRATSPLTIITPTLSGTPAPTAGNTKSHFVFMFGFSLSRPMFTASVSVIPTWIGPRPSSLSATSLTLSCPAPFGPFRPLTALSSSLLHALATNSVRSVRRMRKVRSDRWLFIVILHPVSITERRVLGTNLIVPLLIARDRFADHASGHFTFLPSDNLHAPSLEILVDMEEMLHFPQIMLRKIGNVEILVVIRIVAGDGDDLVVRLPAIEHLEHSQRPAIDLTTRKRRLIDADENVERIAVLVQGARNESVVAGIVHGRVQNPIEPDEPGLLVQLVLVAAATGYFDEGRHQLGRMNSSRQVVPRVDHVVTRSIVPL